MKKSLIAASVAGLLGVLLLAAGLWYFLADDAPDADPAPGLFKTVFVAAVKGATLGPWYLRKAADMPADRLLAEIIAMKGTDVIAARVKPASDAELHGIATRAGHALPTELAAILRTAGAVDALQWAAPADIATAHELYGDKLPGKFHLDDRQWPAGSVRVESHDGTVHRVPTEALERYLVLAEDRLLGDAMLLYDPAEPPAHACCRVIETSPFKSQNHDGFRSLTDYLRWEWAMAKIK